MTCWAFFGTIKSTFPASIELNWIGSTWQTLIWSLQ